jgi:hypothetical protein
MKKNMIFLLIILATIIGSGLFFFRQAWRRKSQELVHKQILVFWNKLPQKLEMRVRLARGALRRLELLPGQRSFLVVEASTTHPLSLNNIFVRYAGNRYRFGEPSVLNYIPQGQGSIVRYFAFQLTNPCHELWPVMAQQCKLGKVKQGTYIVLSNYSQWERPDDNQACFEAKRLRR